MYLEKIKHPLSGTNLKKLVKYKKDLGEASEFVRNKMTPDRKMVYQFAILNELVETWQIDTEKLQEKIIKEQKGAFSPSVFNAAAKEVKTYAERIVASSEGYDSGVIESNGDKKIPCKIVISKRKIRKIKQSKERHNRTKK